MLKHLPLERMYRDARLGITDAAVERRGVPGAVGDSPPVRLMASGSWRD